MDLVDGAVLFEQILKIVLVVSNERLPTYIFIVF